MPSATLLELTDDREIFNLIELLYRDVASAGPLDFDLDIGSRRGVSKGGNSTARSDAARTATCVRRLAPARPMRVQQVHKRSNPAPWRAVAVSHDLQPNHARRWARLGAIYRPRCPWYGRGRRFESGTGLPGLEPNPRLS